MAKITCEINTKFHCERTTNALPVTLNFCKYICIQIVFT